MSAANVPAVGLWLGLENVNRNSETAVSGVFYTLATENVSAGSLDVRV